MEFKTRLRRLREEVLGISQDEMAKRLDVSRNYVAMLERGEKTPSQKIEYRVALIERGEKPISERANQILNKDSDYFTDFDWLVRNGYGSELSIMAKALRRVAEKQKEPEKTKDTPQPFNSSLNETAQEALEEAVEFGEAEIRSSQKPSIGAPSVKKDEPSRSVSKAANPKPSSPNVVQGEREREV